MNKVVTDWWEMNLSASSYNTT